MAGGARPFDTGNAAFQQAYVAGGKPLEQASLVPPASRLLTPAIQSILVQAVSEEPVLRVVRGCVHIEFTPLGTDPALYERRLEIALQIIESWPG